MPSNRQRVRIHPGGPEYEADDVQILESLERWTELRLDDGTVLRVKPLITSVMRVPGQFDPEGNPIYVIKGGFNMVPANVPEDLRKSS